MKFLDIQKYNIVENSVLNADGFYEYNLGNPIEVTTIKHSNSNKLMSSNLSSFVKDDKLMIKYTPTNKVYFSRAFLEGSCDGNFASFYIDKKFGCIYVGTAEEFGSNSGYLVLSGFLSANNYVEKDRAVLCNDKMLNTIKSKVRVLSVGVRGDKLFALYYIPANKGVVIGIGDKSEYGLSSVSGKIKKYSGYIGFTIKDWFDGAKVREL